MNSAIPRAVSLAAPYLNLIILACLAAVLFASATGADIPYSAMIIQVLLGGFIGGITNKIAITMLFERKWYLPGSGVLLKEHQKIV
jgi:hypothetical protein